MNFINTPVHQRFADGEIIVSEGIVSNNAFVVLSGEVRVTKKVQNKTVVIAALKPGEVFGEMGLITDTVRSANVVAVGDVTVGIIDKEKFEGDLNQLPEDLRAIIRAMVERLRITTELLTKIGLELEQTRTQLNSNLSKDSPTEEND